MEQLTEELFQHANHIADEVMTGENIESFLLLMSRLVTHPVENQLLLWKQCPDAKDVAGIRKWKADGIKIKDGEKPLYVILPHITYVENTGIPKLMQTGQVATDNRGAIIYEVPPEFSIGYEVKPVFDINQTSMETSEERGLPEKKAVAESLRSAGFTIMLEKPDTMPCQTPDGYAEGCTFHLPETSDQKKLEKLILNLYVQSRVIAYDENQVPLDIAGFLTDVVVQMAYYGKCKESLKPVAVKCGRLSTDEKMNVLRYVNHYVFLILQFLSVQMLSFTETAIVNGTYDTPHLRDYRAMLQRIAEAVESEPTLFRATDSLITKLLMASPEFAGTLYDKKLNEKVIMSSPALKVPLAEMGG